MTGGSEEVSSKLEDAPVFEFQELLDRFEKESASETEEQVNSIYEDPNLPSIIQKELNFCQIGNGDNFQKRASVFLQALFMLTANSDNFCKNLHENGSVKRMLELLGNQLKIQPSERTDENSIIKLILALCKTLEIAVDAKRTFFETTLEVQTEEVISSTAETSKLKVFTLLLLAIASDRDEVKSSSILNESLPVISLLIGNLSETLENRQEFWIENVAANLARKPAYGAGCFFKMLMIFSRTERNSNILAQQTPLLNNLPVIFDWNNDDISYPAFELLWEMSFSRPNWEFFCGNGEIMNQLKAEMFQVKMADLGVLI